MPRKKKTEEETPKKVTKKPATKKVAEKKVTTKKVKEPKKRVTKTKVEDTTKKKRSSTKATTKRDTPKKERKKRTTKPKSEVVKKKRVPKAPRSKRRWGKIVSISQEYFDFLIGREVRILPKSTDKTIYAIVRWAGYEGLQLPFHPDEIVEIDKPTYLVAETKTTPDNEMLGLLDEDE